MSLSLLIRSAMPSGEVREHGRRDRTSNRVSAYGNVQPPSLSAARAEPDPVGSGVPAPADLAGLFARHAGDIFRYSASRVGHSAA